MLVNLYSVAAYASYSVQLGSFKTIAGLKSLYFNLPDDIKKDIMICKSGSYYTIRYGLVKNKRETKTLISKTANLGIKPVIVECGSELCSDPDIIFLKKKLTAKKSKKPPLPVNNKLTYDSDNTVDFFSGTTTFILPETTTKVILSNTDINRITCNDGPIKDVIYSEEKGLSVQINNNNAFVKFLAAKKHINGYNKLIYPKKPAELYFVCGAENSVYTLIAIPKKIPAQNIQLFSKKNKIKKNLSIFQGIPFEKKVLMLTKYAYQDEIPESFTIKTANTKIDIFNELNLFLKRTVIAEGEGIELNEYLISIKPGWSKEKITLEEKYFLLPELAKNPIGITLEKTYLGKGKTVRLFIVQKHAS